MGKNLYYELFQPIIYEVYDETSVQSYPFYQEVIKKTGKEIPIKKSSSSNSIYRRIRRGKTWV